MDSSSRHRLRSLPGLPHRSLPASPASPVSPHLPAYGRPSAHSRPLLQRTADGYAPPIIDVPERDGEDAPLSPTAALGLVRAAMRLATRAYACLVIVASDAEMLTQLHGGRAYAEAPGAVRYFTTPLVIGCRELQSGGRDAYQGVRIQVSATALRRVLAEPSLGERIADAVLAVAARMHTSAGPVRYAASLTARTGELRTRRLPDCGQDCAVCVGGTAGTARRWEAAGRTLEMERLAKVAADGGGMLAVLPGHGRNGHGRKHVG